MSSSSVEDHSGIEIKINESLWLRKPSPTTVGIGDPSGIQGHRIPLLAGPGMPGGPLNLHSHNPSPVPRGPETRANSEGRRLVDRPISNRLELVGTEFQVRASGWCPFGVPHALLRRTLCLVGHPGLIITEYHRRVHGRPCQTTPNDSVTSRGGQQTRRKFEASTAARTEVHKRVCDVSPRANISIWSPGIWFLGGTLMLRRLLPRAPRQNYESQHVRLSESCGSRWDASGGEIYKYWKHCRSSLA